MEFDRHLSAGGLEWSWNIIAAELLRKFLVGDFDIVITAASIELNVKCFKSELNHKSLRSLQLPLGLREDRRLHQVFVKHMERGGIFHFKWFMDGVGFIPNMVSIEKV